MNFRARNITGRRISTTCGLLCSLVYGLLVYGLLVSGLALAGELRLRDDLGREVVLPGPAQKVISLAPHITEILFAVGAGDEVIATVSYSNFPAAAVQIPRIGSYQAVSYESIVAMNPDLVFAWNSGNGVEMIERIEALGVKVFVSEPRVMEDVSRALRQYGALTGHTDEGETVARQYQDDLDRLRDSYAHQPQMDVFYEVWNSPLMTLNGEHLISDMMRICGGRNVFADAVPLAPRISVESVVRANPQVIIASGMDESRPEWLDEWLAWPAIDAVRMNQLYFIPPDLLQRHGPRLVQGATLLCEYLGRAREAYARQRRPVEVGD